VQNVPPVGEGLQLSLESMQRHHRYDHLYHRNGRKHIKKRKYSNNKNSLNYEAMQNILTVIKRKNIIVSSSRCQEFLKTSLELYGMIYRWYDIFIIYHYHLLLTVMEQFKCNMYAGSCTKS